MSGWGLGPWGLGPFGGLPGPLSVVSALALATRIVRVVLTATPAASSTSIPGDALNPDTWSLTRLDTGFAFTVASIDQVDALTFDVTVVEAFGPSSVQHQVGSTVMQEPTGTLISAPYFALFAGLSIAAQVDSRVSQRDLANRPASAGVDSVGGTLVMSAGGDYDLVAGPDLLRKLIIRRLTTVPGDFAHLPDYGLGFATKEPLRTVDLIVLRREVQRQVLLEPDVDQAQIFLSFDNATGIVTVQVRATMRMTGDVVDTSLQIGT